MKKSKFMSMLMVLAIMLGFTSCLGDNDSNGLEQTDTFSGFLNIYNGSDVLYSGVSYKITRYFEKNTAKVEIQGLKLPDGTSYSTVVLEDLKMSYNSSEWLIISGTNIQASGTNSYIPNLLFDSFSFELHDNMITQNNYTYNTPYLNVTFSVYGTYFGRSIPTNMILSGTTKVTPAGGETFETESPIYGISVDKDTMKGYIVLQGAQFASQMPAMNMKFKDIPFTVDAYGNITLASTESFVPVIIGSDNKETPYPQFPISNLNLVLDPASGMNFYFTCTISKEVQQDGETVTVSTPYEVVVTAKLKNPK